MRYSAGYFGLVMRPSERYLHASALYDDGTLYVCWPAVSVSVVRTIATICGCSMCIVVAGKSFTHRRCKITSSKLYYDTIAGAVYTYSESEVPVDNSVQRNAGPGKRWRHSMSKSKRYEITDSDGTILHRQRVALFGGIDYGMDLAAKIMPKTIGKTLIRTPTEAISMTCGFLPSTWIS